MTTRQRIEQTAEATGWTISRPDETLLVLERKVPMIDRRDEYVLRVYFGPTGTQVRGASYGPLSNSRYIGRSRQDVLNHLTKYRR